LLDAVTRDCGTSCRADQFFLDPEDLDSLGAYLHKANRIPDESVVSAERIGDGNMNLTVRVHTDCRSLVLKQARPWVEKYPHIPAPAERAAVEAAFYRVVSTRHELRRRMPRLLGFDHDSKLLSLEDLGEGRPDEPIRRRRIERKRVPPVGRISLHAS